MVASFCIPTTREGERRREERWVWENKRGSCFSTPSLSHVSHSDQCIMLVSCSMLERTSTLSVFLVCCPVCSGLLPFVIFFKIWLFILLLSLNNSLLIYFIILDNNPLTDGAFLFLLKLGTGNWTKSLIHASPVFCRQAAAQLSCTFCQYSSLCLQLVMILALTFLELEFLILKIYLFMCLSTVTGAA